MLRLVLIGRVLGSGAAGSCAIRLLPERTLLLLSKSSLLLTKPGLLAVYLSRRSSDLGSANNYRLVRTAQQNICPVRHSGRR